MKANGKYGAAAKLRETHFTKEYTRFCVEVEDRMLPEVVVPSEGGELVNIFHPHTCSPDDPRACTSSQGTRAGKAKFNLQTLLSASKSSRLARRRPRTHRSQRP
eukprot:5149058-Pleurochrysis_carterae.AAC.1